MAFCSNCGEEIEDNVKFCGECGTPVSGSASGKEQSTKFEGSPESKKQTKGELLLTLKPVFVPLIKFFPVLAQIIVFLLFFGMFFYIANEPLPDMIYIFAGVFGLFWVGMPLGRFYFQKKTYDKTEYKIFDDHLEYSEGFLNVKINRAKIDRVIDIHYKQSVMQKWFNLGTITLDLAGGGSRNAVKFKDIENPQETYQRVDNLIG